MSALAVFRFALPAWIILALLGAGPACADVTFNVNTVADLVDDNTNDGVCHTSAGNCSLRAAIMQANHWSNPDIAIINVPAGTFVLSIPVPAGGVDNEAVGDLNLTTALIAGQRIVINGQIAASTIIDANQAGRVFTIEPGRTAAISRVTIRGGNSPLNGGGIRNQGDLTLFNTVVEHNIARDFGGGIENYQGTLLVKASTIRSNVATYGGGIDTLGSDRVEIRASTISGNHARYGGGIYNDNNQLLVVNSTFSANTADTNGGGIYNLDGAGVSAFVYNSTIADNDADDDHDEIGGIGGGVYSGARSRLVVVNSLIAANYAVGYVEPDDCFGTLEVYGWNLFGVVGSTCAFSGNGAASRGTISTSTIGPLQDNGGPTWTHALLPGSPAIDSTYDSLGCVDESGTPLSIDQRGANRPAGARCDVGAFEYGAVIDRIFATGFEP